MQSAEQQKAFTSQEAAPQWWQETRAAAWERYNAAPLPARDDERWRFSDIAAITLDGYNLKGADGQPVDGAGVAALSPFTKTKYAASLTFVNNRLAHRAPLPGDLATKGVIFCPLDEAIEKYPQHIQAYLQKHDVALGSEKFTALNTALTTSGALLYVPKGVTIATPLLLKHIAAGDATSVYPHTLVILEDNARATLVEYFASAEPGARHFASGVNDLHAGPGAHLTYIGAQTWSTNTLAFQTNSIVAQRDARILSLNVHLGGRLARHESHSRLQGPGAHSEMLALTVATGAQKFDQRTLQTHQAPNTSSNLLYKNALLDTAKTIFSGLIVVEPDAQKTDAYQSNRNLMLSDDAESNSLPGLEIQANDVRCTHGSTSARIPAEQEFYLQSRGIDPKSAHELLVAGFFEEVLAKLENEEIQTALRAMIEGKFKK
ncbi:Fe-S cluster assembly protein SufD [Ereboglobus sp. PH5-10]|uniref:Fe-S cluster assembly protein SufD n=1 Tax=Ereboglobus sp. PH5-10 TaxID=2940629 RepID=UPI002405080E|nr:Fe-S cluster assembly protein SufD [Ereboglobus sp. PH5-10]MDF9828385.1 Fe-S cluster assembly protein SufD [Ereboglobus sp. PH5-10]